MKIKKITLENFRNHEHLIIKPSQKTTLSGSNGCGKTSVKEAILFALYGRNLVGNNIGLDKQIKYGKTATAVTIEFEDFTIIRKKSSSKNILFYIDGSQPSIQSEVAQRDFETIVPNSELFQAVFDVGYFMRMPENEQRSLVLKHTPDVNAKELAHKTYSWLDEVSQKFPVFFSDYEQERSRLLGLRKSRQRELDSKLMKIETYAEQDDDNGYNIKTLEERIVLLERTSVKEKLCETCHQPLLDPARAEHNKALQEARWELSRLVQAKKNSDINLGELQKETKNLELEISDLTKVIGIFSPNGLPAIEMDLKLKPILKFLQKEIPGLDIKTLEEVKSTLEWKETFRVFVNNVQYNNLSTGEKIKVDIAMSKLLNKISGETINMFFVDHVECLTGKIPTLPGMTLSAEVSESKHLVIKTE